MKYSSLHGENMFCKSCGNGIDIGEKFFKNPSVSE